MERTFQCAPCGSGHDYKTIHNLKRHQQTAGHKRRLDPEFVAVEQAKNVAAEQAKNVVTKRARDENEKARMADRDQCETKFLCRACGDGRDYQTNWRLKVHEETARHKRSLDADFSAAEGAEEVATKKARDEKERARERDAKEKARLANRDQREANRRRDRSAAEKQASGNKAQKAFHKKVAEMGKDVPPIVGTGTEDDALKALVRYHGSTGAAMLLHDDDERIKNNIRKFVMVSPEAKKEIRKAWEGSRMALNTPLASCASCGIRDRGNYVEVDVAVLPGLFKFKRKDHAKFKVLEGGALLRCCHEVELN